VTRDQARGFVEQAGALVSGSGDADENAARFVQVRQRDPAVLFAQTELHRRIAEALRWLDAPG
jgi:hypothetical protein